MGKRQRFLIILESDGHPHAARWLARFLKVCWRGFRLRCVEARELPAAESVSTSGGNKSLGSEERPGREHCE